MLVVNKCDFPNIIMGYSVKAVHNGSKPYWTTLDPFPRFTASEFRRLGTVYTQGGGYIPLDHEWGL